MMRRRSIILGDKKTSVSIEDEFWSGLKEIAKGRRISLALLILEISTEHEMANLSSAVRTFVL